MAAIGVLVNPAAASVIEPFALIWLAAPALARWISLPRARRAAAAPLSAGDKDELRRIARKTWRYFETFVTEAEHYLPPDNFQETPKPVVARRTSPTNIGLYLLSITVAHEMGWIGKADALRRLEQTLATMQKMPKFRGHLYNWHATDDLRVLDPPYVSSVDSGNLAGHLIAVAQACEDWALTGATINSQGKRDALDLARAALADEPADDLAEILNKSANAADAVTLAEAATLAEARCGSDADVTFWIS